MHVLNVHRIFIGRKHEIERLDDLLAIVDVLILCAPLTDMTRGMIDAAALARMKPGGILINVGRGPVVVEAALVQALQSGHLAAAGLDVTAAGWCSGPGVGGASDEAAVERAHASACTGPAVAVGGV